MKGVYWCFYWKIIWDTPTWWLIPRIVSGWNNPGDFNGIFVGASRPLKKLGWTNPLTIRGMNHQAWRWKAPMEEKAKALSYAAVAPQAAKKAGPMAWLGAWLKHGFFLEVFMAQNGWLIVWTIPSINGWWFGGTPPILGTVQIFIGGIVAKIIGDLSWFIICNWEILGYLWPTDMFWSGNRGCPRTTT